MNRAIVIILLAAAALGVAATLSPTAQSTDAATGVRYADMLRTMVGKRCHVAAYDRGAMQLDFKPNGNATLARVGRDFVQVEKEGRYLVAPLLMVRVTVEKRSD